MRRQPAGIAIARSLFAAGLAGIDQRDTMAVAQRLDGADHADRAGPDDGNVTAHQRAFSCATKSLPTEIARGSMKQSRIDGLPVASARSNAGAKSSVRSTRSP